MAEKKPNHLIGETSPYLLQHAYNPVEWYPWSAAAFERAKNEDKPVLVSIGYAACHWCHVMEHESFENETTATFMNTWFINIKVDREERPDIDHIYMNACQVMTGAGGWPLNIFLTPALLPFSGGTYFPPKPGFGKPSWMEVLMFIKNTFSTERDKVEEQATMLTDHMLKMDNAFVGELIEIPEGEKLFTHGEIGSSIEILKENFDTTEGGFGRAPKFLSTMVLLYLLRKNFFAPDKAIRDQVQLSLRKMMLGGIFDHVGGGFSRYTIDQKWMVPHFEKMLYDNALLVNLYAEAYMAEKNNDHRDVIIKTLDFLMLEMLQHEGGFYSSYDADSEGVEGKFYTYSFNEIENLFPGEMEFITTLYNLKKEGNWEHTNILFRTKTNAEIAGAFNLSLEAVNDKITAINSDLYAYRKKRIPPALDDKILLGWNALACSAFVMGYRATGIEKYKSMAIRNIDFLIHAFSNKETPGELLHTYKNNIAKYPAFIEDYASMIQALMDIYELTSDEKYMEAALNYIDFTVAHFIGDDDMFYFTKRSQADVPIRNKDFYDNATPSGNSMMVNNLLRMAVLSGKNELRQQVEIMLSKLKKTMLQYPPSFGNWLCSALKVVYPPAEIAITGNHASEFKNEILRHYYPHTIIQIDEQGDLQYPLIQNRFNDEGTFIYLCRNNTCHLPVSNVQDFLNELKEF